MKKKYAKPDILCERLASYNVITTSPEIEEKEAADPDAPVLSPKRRGIWDDED